MVRELRNKARQFGQAAHEPRLLGPVHLDDGELTLRRPSRLSALRRGRDGSGNPDIDHVLRTAESARDVYMLCLNDVRVGVAAVPVDMGTSTAELHLAMTADSTRRDVVASVAELVAEALVKSVPDLRRVSVNASVRDTEVKAGLSAVGFVSEGWAPPLVTDRQDRGAPSSREMLTLFLQSDDRRPHPIGSPVNFGDPSSPK